MCSSAVASDTLRPALLASTGGLELVLEALSVLCDGLEARPAEVHYHAVPQYAPLIEAAASVGQALKSRPLAGFGAAADAVSRGLMSLAAALSGLQHRTLTEKHVTLGIEDVVQAAIALARLGIGSDARGVPIPQAMEAQAPLGMQLMGGGVMTGRETGQLKFTIRNT